MKKWFSGLLKILICGTSALMIAACYGVPVEFSDTADSVDRSEAEAPALTADPEVSEIAE